MGECLTNVLKHTGPGTRAEVVVDHQPRQLVVSITDDGRGLAASSDDGRGWPQPPTTVVTA